MCSLFLEDLFHIRSTNICDKIHIIGGREYASFNNRDVDIAIKLRLMQKVLDGWLASLRPFQQYFSHIRRMGG